MSDKEVRNNKAKRRISISKIIGAICANFGALNPNS